MHDDEEEPDPAAEIQAEIDAETTNGAWRAIDGRFWELPNRPLADADRKKRRKLTKIVIGLLPRAASGDPTAALQAIRLLRPHLAELEHEAIALAKSSGWSWRHIAEELGISRSAAQRRFR
jgi:hypothetical protein